ncbi:hypothetical protein ACFWGD_02480 [Corynebacterium sp. NPDC060344]|uniref:hypothetical protein n=1 Tax=Corynebacterium sp. NPDC060344 TaxID=3347101 RepID=UPI00364B7CC9
MNSSADRTPRRSAPHRSTPHRSTPFHAAQASRLWRIAVAVYLPALALSVATAMLNWDRMIDAAMSGTTGTLVPTESQAQTSVLISVGFATVMQGLVAGVCWVLAGKLLRGSVAARMILSVAAIVFCINAVLSIIAMATGANETGAGEGAAEFIDSTVTVLIVVASAIAAWATVQAYRGADNRSFFATT